ncbi:MAG: dTDP-4-dehydrorhamnose 3,5-epimerase family protein [Elusimicrobiota bacterium]
MKMIIRDSILIDLVVHKDPRGQLFEIMRSDARYFHGFGQAYVTACNPGYVKAWHYHKKQWDNFCVVNGKMRVVLYDNRETSKSCGKVQVIDLSSSKPQLLIIPPKVVHGFACISKKACYVLNMPTKLYNYKTPDEFRIPLASETVPYRLWRKCKGW